MKRLGRWLLSLLLPRTEAENDYYAWADVRLDHLAGDHRWCDHNMRPDIRRGHTKASNHRGFVNGCPDCMEAFRHD